MAPRFILVTSRAGCAGIGRRPTARFDEGELLDKEKDWLVADITPDGAELVLVNREEGRSEDRRSERQGGADFQQTSQRNVHCA